MDKLSRHNAARLPHSIRNKMSLIPSISVTEMIASICIFQPGQIFDQMLGDHPPEVLENDQ
jgi:hypothetical protein